MIIEQKDFKSDLLKKYKVVIFGEIHFQYEGSVLFINNNIKKFEPNLLMHELLPPQKLINKNKALDLIKSGQIINKDIGAEIPDLLELIVEINCLGYGFELPSNNYLHVKDNNEKFLLRENLALEKLKSFRKLYKKVAFVIGDTHLRSQGVEDLLTSSPIYEYAKTDNSILLVRSKYKEVK